MTLETFFKKFELFADAPDAVARMRQLVLQLAVQGKLVEQKVNDGSASAIFTEELPAPGETRYSLPHDWIWIRFAAVGQQRLGKMLDKSGNRGQLKPYLRNINVQWMRFQLDDIQTSLNDLVLAGGGSKLISLKFGGIGERHGLVRSRWSRRCAR